MVKTLREGGGVMSAVVLGDKIFLGTNTMASEFDLNTGERRRTFEGAHADYVWAIAIDAEHLYTGSSNFTTVQWSLATGKEVRRFVGETPVRETRESNPAQSHVWSLTVCGGKLYSGASDCVVRQWDTQTGALDASFKGHKGWITSLSAVEKSDADELYTGSADGTVRPRPGS
jgi:WD40 repeat protein